MTREEFVVATSHGGNWSGTAGTPSDLAEQRTSLEMQIASNCTENAMSDDDYESEKCEDCGVRFAKDGFCADDIVLCRVCSDKYAGTP
jgi:hypothetical protein